MIICAGVILLWAENIMGIFTDESGLVEMGGVFLRIATAGYLFIAISTVLQNSIAGAGDTVPNMIISVVMVWILQLPLAFVLSKYTDFGVYGIRWAIVSGIFVATIAYVIYFRLGKWKTKKL